MIEGTSVDTLVFHQEKRKGQDTKLHKYDFPPMLMALVHLHCTKRLFGMILRDFQQHEGISGFSPFRFRFFFSLYRKHAIDKNRQRAYPRPFPSPILYNYTYYMDHLSSITETKDLMPKSLLFRSIIIFIPSSSTMMRLVFLSTFLFLREEASSYFSA
ncbi:hypothetical protein F4810DRAFT_365997 [Camillea tinctor]|nr:hypothetical protein F4810DRAFT_365997 [Camillea tinctor]